MSNELVPAPNLGDLADGINHEHAQTKAALRSGLDHARAAGQLLLQAQDACQQARRPWLAWLKANVRASPRTAQAYMRVAREWDRLKCATVAHLGYREALEALAEPPESPDPAEGDAEEAEAGEPKRWNLEEWGEGSRHKTFEAWPDLLATFTYLLDLRGWSAEKIATWAGRPVQEIELILDPRPPMRWHCKAEGAGLFDGAASQQAVQQAYQREIENLLGAWQERALASAAYNAQRQGWADTQQAAQTLCNQAQRRRERQGAVFPLFDLEFTDSHYAVALWCCASEDAQAGFGIAPVQGALLERLNIYLDEGRGQAAG